MLPSNATKSDRKHARKKRNLEERQSSYSQITDWNPDIPTAMIAENKPTRTTISNRCVVRKSHVAMLVILLAVCCTSIALSLGYGLQRVHVFDPVLLLEERPPPSASPLKKFNHAIIASDADECAEIGAEILRQNGSAVDAAVAALLCVGVINCQSAGIGGGFMMTVYDRSTGQAAALLARETAPAAATRHMYVDDPIEAQLGWRSVGVPGEIAGYWEAHQKYGRLPWKQLFEPTIRLCRDGYHVNEHQAKKLIKEKQHIVADPVLKSLFIDPESGEPFGRGQLVRRPLLAETLQKLADGGADEFYRGSVAEQLVKDMQEHGGIITLEDLKQYKARWVTPVSTTLGDGMRVFGVPPPGSGSLVAFILNILDGYKYHETTLDSMDKLNLMYHRMTEAFKFGYARRTEIGDPTFVNITQLVSELSSAEYAASVRARIDDARTSNIPEHYGAASVGVEDAGTAHVSVIDAHGSAVSVTSTVNLVFGSKVVSPSTGILFNDQMDDFSTPGAVNYFNLPPSPANYIEPGKMMMSSMCPTLFVDADGDVRLATGAAGGSRITTATVYTAFRHLYMGEDMKQAVDFPRIHHQLFPMTLHYNKGFPQASREYLASKGHLVEEWDKHSVVPMVGRVGYELHGVMDYRKHAGDVRGF